MLSCYYSHVSNDIKGRLPLTSGQHQVCISSSAVDCKLKPSLCEYCDTEESVLKSVRCKCVSASLSDARAAAATLTLSALTHWALLLASSSRGTFRSLSALLSLSLARAHSILSLACSRLSFSRAQHAPAE